MKRATMTHMSAKKLLMLVGDYAEDYEVMIPFQALRMVGHQVDAVCPDKRAGDRIRTSIHDFEGDQTYTEKVGHNFILNATFDEIRPEDYDALLIPGGRAPEYLRTYPRVLELARHFASANKVIGAICHGTQVLAAAGVLGGRSCSCYPPLSFDLLLAGARFVDIPLDAAHTDGNLVTAPAWPAQSAWLAQLLKVLGTRIEV
jgi:protease I